MDSNSLGSVWSSMRTIAGLQNTTDSTNVTSSFYSWDTDFANALNCSYHLFNMFDFSKEIQEVSFKCVTTSISLENRRMWKKAFHCTKVNKSHRPDNLCGRPLKTCARELSPVFHIIFNKSLEAQNVPRIWKDTAVVWVPNSSRSTTLNDFRSAALTSIIMKIFEKLACLGILKSTESATDELHFALRPKRRVEDAPLTLLNVLIWAKILWAGF